VHWLCLSNQGCSAVVAPSNRQDDSRYTVQCPQGANHIIPSFASARMLAVTCSIVVPQHVANQQTPLRKTANETHRCGLEAGASAAKVLCSTGSC
jgi:hypothetical protein